MKTNIFYFSGTGNSLKVAREIAAGLDDTELISIAKAIKGNIDLSADRIGIVFPVYAWGLPLIVADFVKKMQKNDEKYVFSVITYGGSPAKTNIQLQKMLEEKGIKLNAGFAINYPGNYLPIYGAWKDEKQQKLFSASIDRISNILSYIKDKKSGMIETGGVFMNWFGSLCYGKIINGMKTADKNFYADDKCNKCGICEKVCPVSNIKLVDGKPTWHNNCQQCLACIQWCPVESIQAGKSTVGKKRYHHPGVKVNDFYC